MNFITKPVLLHILLPPDKNVHIEKTCNAYMLLFKLTHYKRICIGRNNKVVFVSFFDKHLFTLVETCLKHQEDKKQTTEI